MVRRFAKKSYDLAGLLPELSDLATFHGGWRVVMVHVDQESQLSCELDLHDPWLPVCNFEVSWIFVAMMHVDQESQLSSEFDMHDPWLPACNSEVICRSFCLCCFLVPVMFAVRSCKQKKKNQWCGIMLSGCDILIKKWFTGIFIGLIFFHIELQCQEITIPSCLFSTNMLTWGLLVPLFIVGHRLFLLYFPFLSFCALMWTKCFSAITNYIKPFYFHV